MRQTEFVSSEVYQSHSPSTRRNNIARLRSCSDKYIIDPALEEIVILCLLVMLLTVRHYGKLPWQRWKRYTDRQGRVVIRVFDTAVKPLSLTATTSSTKISR